MGRLRRRMRRRLADLFTKILDKATFLKHTKVILGHVGDTGAEHARRTRTGSRDGAP